MEETLAEHQIKDIQEAEEMAHEELKPNYLLQLISRYKYIVGMTAALKKDPIHQRTIKSFGKKKIMMLMSICSM